MGDGSEDEEIFSMKPNGSDKTRLTNNNTSDSDPAVSPNGRWVLFEREVGGSDEIFKMRSNGSRVKRLTRNSGDSIYDVDPAWAPGGNRIVFASDRASSAFLLYTMRANGNDVDPVTAGSIEDPSPHWSPNGNWISFTRTLGGNPDTAICLVRPNGNNDHCITGGFFDSASDPDWSPNSKAIVFEGEEEADVWIGDNVFLIRTNGSDLMRLLPGTTPRGTQRSRPTGRRSFTRTAPTSPAGYFGSI